MSYLKKIPASEKQAEFLDLDQEVRDWAWQQFYRSSKTKEEKNLTFEDVNIYPDYKDVVITHGCAQYFNEQTAKLPKSSNLFKTTFRNNTNMEQEYSVNANRSTRSTCEVEIGRTFTVGGEVSVKVAVPGNVVEANAGFKTELQLQKCSRHIEENELSWGIDSTIKVPSMHMAVAEIQVVEEKMGCEFTVLTTMSGRVRASITNPKENNKFVMACAGDVSKVFSRFNNSGNCQECYLVDRELNIITKGNVNFRFGVEQIMCLNQYPM